MADDDFICLDCKAELSDTRSAQLHEAARSHRVWPAVAPLPDDERAIASAVARISPIPPPSRRVAGAVHLSDEKPPYRRHRAAAPQDPQARWHLRQASRAIAYDLAAAGMNTKVRASPVGRYWH